MAADRKTTARYDVDPRAAGPVSLFAVIPLAQPSADGEKSHPAGDAAMKLPRVRRENMDLIRPSG